MILSFHHGELRMGREIAPEELEAMITMVDMSPGWPRIQHEFGTSLKVLRSIVVLVCVFAFSSN